MRYSLANIDDTENSPITEWYMKMFGMLPGNISNNPLPVLGDRAILNINSLTQQQMDLVRTSFRKMASTSVGRVLLYRLLIEIFRIAHGGNNTEGPMVVEIPGLFADQVLIARNECRSMSVLWGNPEFQRGNRIITVNDVEGIVITVDETNVLRFKLTSMDVALFHEMCHWYQFLRYPDRFNIENNNNFIQPVRILAPTEGTVINTYYHNNITPVNLARTQVSEQRWSSPISGQFADFVEMRNILGLPEGTPYYYNGDDLSDNLYRACLGESLRVCYNNPLYHEDPNVIQRIRNTVQWQMQYYNHYPSNPIINPVNCALGIGECAVQW